MPVKSAMMIGEMAMLITKNLFATAFNIPHGHRNNLFAVLELACIFPFLNRVKPIFPADVVIK
jgi:hypothetical protein